MVLYGTVFGGRRLLLGALLRTTHSTFAFANWGATLDAAAGFPADFSPPPLLPNAGKAVRSWRSSTFSFMLVMLADVVCSRACLSAVPPKRYLDSRPGLREVACASARRGGWSGRQPTRRSCAGNPDYARSSFSVQPTSMSAAAYEGVVTATSDLQVSSLRRCLMSVVICNVDCVVCSNLQGGLCGV